MGIRQHQLIISLLCITTILVIIIILIIYPALRDILTINTTIAQEKEILEEKLALGLNIKTTEKIMASIDQTQPILDSVFIQQGKELDFITQIEQAAATHMVSPELKPNFSGKNITPNVSEVTIEINATGDYLNLHNFLKAIEQLPYYYTTEALIISRAKSGEASSMQLLGKAYLLK
jgi:Tfp pilus assembly protein PilO